MDVSSIRSRGQALGQGLQQQELPEEASERSLRRREDDELRGAAGGHGRLRRVLALGGAGGGSEWCCRAVHLHCFTRSSPLYTAARGFQTLSFELKVSF